MLETLLCTSRVSCARHLIICPLGTVWKELESPCMVLESASKSLLALLDCTLPPLRCMSFSALCSALSVASAGRSPLSSPSLGTFDQSVLQTNLTGHESFHCMLCELHVNALLPCSDARQSVERLR